MKKDMSLFLRWWLLFLSTLVLFGFSFYTGLIPEMVEKDSSYLCLVIMTVFLGCSIKCGIDSFNFAKCDFRFAKSDKTKKDNLYYYERCEEIGWFLSEFLLSAGLLGTLWGFVLMLNGFETLNVSDPKTIQNLLSQLGSSFSVALYTTISGLVCGTILKFQYFNLSLGIQKYMEEINEN